MMDYAKTMVIASPLVMNIRSINVSVQTSGRVEIALLR